MFHVDAVVDGRKSSVYDVWQRAQLIECFIETEGAVGSLDDHLCGFGVLAIHGGLGHNASIPLRSFYQHSVLFARRRRRNEGRSGSLTWGDFAGVY